jgi:predicted Zn-dependent protease
VNPRLATAAALALLAAAGFVVHAGKLYKGRNLEAVATLWGDVFRDTTHAASLPFHVSDDEEIRLGQRLAANVRARYSIDTAHQPAVVRIGALVAAHASTRVPYTFLAIDEPSINAFALPGGPVFITRGLVEFVQSDDELAAVIGHELAHIDRRHCLDGHRYQVVLSRLDAPAAGELMDAMQQALARSYSREQEFEADRRGTSLAWAAGYDGARAAQLFRRLAALEPQPRTGWLLPYLESHPAALERAARLERELQLR